MQSIISHIFHGKHLFLLALKQKFIKHINGKYKEINIKNRTCYFFNDLIDTEDFNPNLLKIDKNSYKTLIFIVLDTLQLKI